MIGLPFLFSQTGILKSGSRADGIDRIERWNYWNRSGTQSFNCPIVTRLQQEKNLKIVMPAPQSGLHFAVSELECLARRSEE